MSVITMITYQCSGIEVASILVFLMCVTLGNIYSLGDNHVITILVSICLQVDVIISKNQALQI